MKTEFSHTLSGYTIITHAEMHHTNFHNQNKKNDDCSKISFVFGSVKPIIIPNFARKLKQFNVYHFVYVAENVLDYFVGEICLVFFFQIVHRTSNQIEYFKFVEFFGWKIITSADILSTFVCSALSTTLNASKEKRKTLSELCQSACDHKIFSDLILMHLKTHRKWKKEKQERQNGPTTHSLTYTIFDSFRRENFEENAYNDQ